MPISVCREMTGEVGDVWEGTERTLTDASIEAGFQEIEAGHSYSLEEGM
jgi:hypothetical protein